ncbi:unnamed protein product [Phytomonas sp. EM1]|nr:unnamed protein product [Phytomonas sp. EM1]|eukprot:CCW61585.1 unnamed protein product [Phytomonas sp. isolate EM1]
MFGILSLFKDATVYEIIAWHRPVASAVVLGSILSFWLLFVYWQYTILTFLCRCIQLVFLLGAAATATKSNVVYSDLTGKMDAAYESIRPCAAKILGIFVDVVIWRDVMFSAKVFGASLVMAYIGNYICDSTFILLVTIISFSGPVLYEKNKPLIHDQLRVANRYVNQYIGVLRTKGELLKQKVRHVDANAGVKAQAESKLDELFRKNQ